MNFKFVIFFFAMTISAFAQVWTGSISSDVSNKNNWIGNAPKKSSWPTFENSLNTTVYFDWPSATNKIAGINFNSNASSYTFNGSNATRLRVRDITNHSNNQQIFNINLDFKNNSTIDTDGNLLLNGNIIVGGGNNLNFDGNGSISFGQNIVLADDINLRVMNGLSIDLGGNSLSISSLEITDDTLIDFSNGASLSLETLVINCSAQLLIANWNEQSSFMVNSIAGNVLDRIYFVGYGKAKWDDTSFHVTPIPESKRFGAGFVLMALIVIFFAKRFKK